jgi:hypothetical protein
MVMMPVEEGLLYNLQMLSVLGDATSPIGLSNIASRS